MTFILAHQRRGGRKEEETSLGRREEDCLGILSWPPP